MAIHVGIGGWTFAPWRGSFYPEKLKHDDELSFASRHLTSIEVNGTFYRTQSPSTFRKWAQQTPEGFVFSLKAPRFATNRTVLAEAGPSIERFVESGITELGPKLGPILWQFAPTKKFDTEDFDAFLALLPREADGRPLRHAMEVRHESFRVPEFPALLRKHGAALVYAHSEDYPEFADLTTDFVYARLQRTVEEEIAGYSPADLDRWADVARSWAAGKAPSDLPYIDPTPPKAEPRDCYLYFISGAKVRAPHAAQALIERLKA